MQLLPNTHISAESAYVVDDYPYGFRLRCKMRYWLEYKPGKGFRLWSQSSNPKKPGLVWNKPKASVYCRFAGAMFLNDEGHVRWNGVGEYSSGAEAIAFREQYGPAIPAAGLHELNEWIAAKVAYEAKRAAVKAESGSDNLPLGVGLREAQKAWLDEALKQYPKIREGEEG